MRSFCKDIPVGARGLWLSAVLCAVATGVWSQTASQITPGDLTPASKRLTGTLVFDGGSGTQAPAGAEQITIRLSGVTVAGGLPDMKQAEAALRARLTSGRIPVSEIFAATSALEAGYANAGFVLSRVVLPQQALQDGGALRIEVVNGFVERIDDTAIQGPIRRRIGTVTAPLLDVPGLTQADLERSLLLAGDTPGVALQSALATGQKPGGTVIVLEPEYRPVTGFLGVDNQAAANLGGATFSSGIELNSTLNLGETLYARLSGASDGLFTDDPRYRVLGLGAIFPFGPSGLMVNYEYTQSATRPADQDAPTTSDFARHSLRLSYPFLRARAMNISGQASLDMVQDTQDLIGTTGKTPIYEDALTVLRLGADLSRTGPTGTFTEASVTLSQGLDILGARSQAEAGAGTPLSRRGSDAVFSSLAMDGSHQRFLSERINLSVFGSVQSSFGTALPTSEQFSVAGPRALSPFDAGAVRGDSGWVVRAEIATTLAFDWGGNWPSISPYAFAGIGSVNVTNPTALESSKITAQAYGVGLDLMRQTDSSFRSGVLRVEFGRGERDDGGSDGNRFSVSGNFRF